MAMKRKSLKVPKTLQTRFAAITALTDQVAGEYLNAEYADLACYAAAALSRKRPSPLASGRVATWACGILYALGTVNFLFDKNQDPHLRAEDLARFCGVSKSTAANQGRKVRGLLDMYQGDPEWCLPSFMDANPFVWMLNVNGFVMDIRNAPLEVQKMAYEEGLIPYVPGQQD